jgi:rubrerythrin
MDVFNYALQFEKDGEAFYRAGAAEISDPNLADILLFLAGEERKHYRLIKDLKEHTADHPKSIFISDINNVFSRMKAKNERFTAPKDTVTALLEKAMEIEDDSVTYYRQARSTIDDPQAKDLLALLAKQEEVHYALLSSIIEYYETPHLWLEQAEFNQHTDY